LLSGYKKGGKVYRTEKTKGERLVPEAFDPYSPKMIANISGLEDVLECMHANVQMKSKWGLFKPIQDSMGVL
jgi:hypothetical protein